MTILVNFLAFQAGWFACVLGAAYHKPLLGSSIALTVVVFHLVRAAEPVAELKLTAAAAVIGLLFDPTLALTGLLSFTSGAVLGGALAYWMVVLWMLFATTLNVSLRWLKERAPLAVAFGAVGGPLAYLGGEKLGALHVERPLGIAAIAFGWSLAMWLLVLFARRFDGVAAWSATPRQT